MRNGSTRNLLQMLVRLARCGSVSMSVYSRYSAQVAKFNKLFTIQWIRGFFTHWNPFSAIEECSLFCCNYFQVLLQLNLLDMFYTNTWAINYILNAYLHLITFPQCISNDITTIEIAIKSWKNIYFWNSKHLNYKL